MIHQEVLWFVPWSSSLYTQAGTSPSSGVSPESFLSQGSSQLLPFSLVQPQLSNWHLHLLKKASDFNCLDYHICYVRSKSPNLQNLRVTDIKVTPLKIYK